MCVQLQYNELGQCIHVITHELFVQGAQHKDQNSSTLKPLITASGTWHKVIICHLDKAFD